MMPLTAKLKTHIMNKKPVKYAKWKNLILTIKNCIKSEIIFGKYRRPAHNICNLRYTTLKKFLQYFMMVLHMTIIL